MIRHVFCEENQFFSSNQKMLLQVFPVFLENYSFMRIWRQDLEDLFWKRVSYEFFIALDSLHVKLIHDYISVNHGILHATVGALLFLERQFGPAVLTENRCERHQNQSLRNTAHKSL